MTAAVQPINLIDFKGGLNLRANEFQLGDNESPDILNVEVDPSGGIYTRQGWERWSVANVTADAWDPKQMFVQQTSSAVEVTYVTNAARVHRTSSGTFSRLDTAAATPLVVGASPHLASFTTWGDDCYIGCGRTNQSAKLVNNGTYATLLTAIAAANFNNNYLAPVGGKFPTCEHITAHGGRIWVANTREDGVNYPNRIRWSHPNQPEDWAAADFVDIKAGNGPIVAIRSFEDHLLVFKQSSIWAIYGFDGEDQQVQNISRTLGAVSTQVVAVNESACFFMSWPDGIHEISGGKVTEVSEALRPAFRSADWNSAALGQMWLGWLGKRLWFSAPYKRNAVVSDATSVFVYDPSISAWVMFRSATDTGLGPFVQGGYGSAQFLMLAASRSSPNIVRVDARDNAQDNLAGTPVGFKSSYTTRWLHAGWPDRKKRWRRPTFIVRAGDSSYSINCSVFTDYEENTVRRIFTVSINPATGAVVYNGGLLYDNDVLYSEDSGGSVIARGSGLGTARAVQLKLEGTPGVAWGINGVIAKLRMRRFT